MVLAVICRYICVDAGTDAAELKMRIRMRNSWGRAGLALFTAVALAGCEGGGGGGTGVDPEPETFRVTAFSENLSCNATTCGVDFRGTARDDDGAFISGATVFSYVSRSGSERVAGPSTTTNAGGGYVMRFNFPASATGNYDVRICAGIEIRPADARCAQIVFGIS